MATRVVVIGGGSGGTILANALSDRRFQVVLISAAPDHLFQPGLLYTAFTHSRTSLVRAEPDLLKPRVEYVPAWVKRVDFTAKTVTLLDERRLDYDIVVLATGIRTDPVQIPGLAEVNDRIGDYHSTVAQAEKLWRSLEGFGGGTIALGTATPICKCPPSPVEGILLTEQLMRRRGQRDKTRLVFFTPYPRPYPARPMNELVEPILKQRGIETRCFFDLDHIDPHSGTLYSIEGEEIQAELPIVVPPFTGADIVYTPGDVIDPDRFLITDKTTLKVRGVEGAYAIGDATNLPTSKSGVGAHLEAHTVARALMGRPTPFAGRTHCPMDLGYGQGTFVIGSYDAPVVKLPPSRFKHFMKMMFERIYWTSLRGTLDPVFNIYFRMTAPKPPPGPAVHRTV